MMRHTNTCTLILVTCMLLPASALKSPNYIMEDGCPPECICSVIHDEVSINCASAAYRKVPENLNSAVNLLDLRDNRIRELTPWAFGVWSLPHLLRLHMPDNHIREIHKDAFLGLRNLTFLDLSRNDLVDIHLGTFSELPRLRFLNLSNNPIHKVSTLTSLSLRKVVMVHCKISILEETSLAHLPRLEHLDLSWNPLEKVETPTAFSLHTLNISNCLVKEIPANFMTTLDQLTLLNLSCNPLQRISIKDCETLKTIDLSRCKLSNLSKAVFANLPKLKHLRLSWSRDKESKERFQFNVIDEDSYELSYDADISNFSIGSCTFQLGDNVFMKVETLLLATALALVLAFFMISVQQSKERQAKTVPKEWTVTLMAKSERSVDTYRLANRAEEQLITEQNMEETVKLSTSTKGVEISAGDQQMVPNTEEHDDKHQMTRRYSYT